MLALTFANPGDWDLVQQGDQVDILDLASLAPRESVTMVLNHQDGSSDRITCNHSMTADQIGWFKAGSSLNLIREQASG